MNQFDEDSNPQLRGLASAADDRTPSNAWDIEKTVAELRAIREASLAARHRSGCPLKLPSRKNLTAIVEGITAVLFPNRLGSRPLNQRSVDYFVGRTLDTTLTELVEQAQIELSGAVEGDPPDVTKRTQTLVGEFSRNLPEIRLLLETDIRANYDGDPAAQSVDEILVCYPGIVAIIHHRIAHVLHGLGLPLIARMIAELAHSMTGIDIHPAARIGDHFFIDHGTGVVIGETAIIGSRVRLYHGVTLGARRVPADELRNSQKGHARHPILEDDVVVYANATILGRVTVGRGSTIGGNVWLIQDVPAGSHVSQAQLRSELFDDGSGI